MSLSREQRLEKIDEIKDKEIDYSDIPELDETFRSYDRSTKHTRKR